MRALCVIWAGFWLVSILPASVMSFSQYMDFYELNRTCHHTWSLFEASFNVSKISRIDFIQGNQLEICDSFDAKCCNRRLENNLSQLSLKQYRKAFLNKNLLPLKTSLINYAYNFDNLVTEILDMSRVEFGHEFNKTYHWRHLNLFEQFFAGLRSYYSEYQVSLKEIVRKLFANVARLIVSWPGTKTSSPHRLQVDERCFDEFLLDSDMRIELERKLESALESARLLSASLTKMRDLVIELDAKFDSTASNRAQCTRELTQIYSCAMCSGDELMARINTVRPCYRSCIDAYKTCIGLDFSKLDPVWNLYINLIKNLSQTIEFKMNFEATINGLKFEIMDIIFNYRVNSDLVVAKLRKKCSNITSQVQARPGNQRGLSRQRRQLPTDESLKIKLHVFFIDLNSYLYNLTYFWSQLVTNACKASTNADSLDCWNGTNIISKSSSKSAKLSGRTTPANDSVLNRTFWSQIQTLKLYTIKMSRQIDKINSNEKLFSAKANFRVLVDSNKDAEALIDEQPLTDQDDYDDESFQDEYDYYDTVNRVTNLKEIVPKGVTSGGDQGLEEDYYEEPEDEDYDEEDAAYQDDYYEGDEEWSSEEAHRVLVDHKVYATSGSNKSQTFLFPRIAQKVKDLYFRANAANRQFERIYVLCFILVVLSTFFGLF